MKPKSDIKGEKTCRICLCDAEVLKSLHDKFGDEQKSILETINFVVNIDMKLNRDLPDKICNDCVTKLDIAHIFTRRCLNSEEILGQYHLALKKREFFEKVPVTFEKEPENSVHNLLDDLIKEEDKLAVYANVSITKNKKNKTDLHAVQPHTTEIEDDVTTSIKVETEPFGNVFDDTEYIDKNVAVIAIEPHITEIKDDKISSIKVEIEPFGNDFDDDTEYINSNEDVNVNTSSVKPSKPSILNTVKAGNIVKQKKKKSRAKGPFICNYCSKEYVAKHSLTKHINFKHKMLKEKLECPMCSKTYDNKYKYKAHMHEHRVKNGGIKKNVSCKKCDRKFKYETHLKQHMKSKHASEYTCKLCDKICATRDIFQEHKKEHGKQLCPFCGKWLLATSWHDHSLRHQSIKDYQCDKCEQRFVTKSDLMVHKRFHDGELQFQCDICGKASATSSARNYHRRTHSDDRPYGCEYCPMRFKFAPLLKRHTRTHTGEKPYKCTVCDAAFPRSHHLTNHMRGHAKDTPNIEAVMAAAKKKPGRRPMLCLADTK